MILSITELRRFIETDEDDAVLEARLQAIETAIKGYTHNNFTRVLAANGGVWPADIRMGVVYLLKWDMDRREKVGVSAETISRHSVTYESASAENTVMGYPAALTAFLRPYKRARFGQGVQP